jgi:lipoyl(octanoyl) transferase
MWHLLHSPPSDGAFNMALDEALMAHAQENNAWVLRVYSWSSPTLSLGRNQTAIGVYDLERLAAQAIGVVRRPTGGRAILHHREVTYSVVGPVTDAGDLQESYARINRLLIAALHELGVHAVVVGSDEARHTAPELNRPGPIPCFHHPSSGEISLNGRKLVASAQWRCSDVLLQHGSILVDDDQMQLTALTRLPGVQIPRPATLCDALGAAPSESVIADALFAAARALEDSDATMIDLDGRLLDRAKMLRQHYLDDSWTWRR